MLSVLPAAPVWLRTLEGSCKVWEKGLFCPWGWLGHQALETAGWVLLSSVLLLFWRQWKGCRGKQLASALHARYCSYSRRLCISLHSEAHEGLLSLSFPLLRIHWFCAPCVYRNTAAWNLISDFIAPPHLAELSQYLCGVQSSQALQNVIVSS